LRVTPLDRVRRGREPRPHDQGGHGGDDRPGRGGQRDPDAGTRPGGRRGSRRMRIVLALGGNALLRRSEPMTAEVQRRNARIAAEAMAPLVADHELVVAHGNGPQVGLLALQADAYREIEPIRYRLDRHVLVICAGGGGIPTTSEPGNGRRMVGVEAVIDKDLASELLAEDLGADLLVMATDVAGVFVDWGTPRQRQLLT